MQLFAPAAVTARRPWGDDGNQTAVQLGDQDRRRGPGRRWCQRAQLRPMGQGLPAQAAGGHRHTVVFAHPRGGPRKTFLGPEVHQRAL